MELPSDIDEPGRSDLTKRDPEQYLAARVEREELERRLELAQRKERRHLLWMVLGISPAAVIPALGLLREGSMGLLLVLVILVTLTQVVSWTRASRSAEALEKELESLSAGE